MRIREQVRGRHRAALLVALAAVVFGAGMVPSASAGTDPVSVLRETGASVSRSTSTGGRIAVSSGSGAIPAAARELRVAAAALSAAGACANPWDGDWLRVEHSGSMTVVQTGGVVSSFAWEWFGEMGTGANLSQNGDALSGRFTRPSDGKQSTWVITVSGDGTSFSGTWQWVDGSGSGSFGGRRASGYSCVDESSPPPPPPPKPSAKGLGIEYSMPARFGKRGKNGLVEYPTRKQIAPRSWRVDFVVRRKDGKRCRRSDVLTAKAGKARFFRKGRNPCRFYGLFAKEGTYKLKVTLRSGKGANRKTRKAARRIVVQDWLIVGLGDSNGSGEGVPDIPKPSALSSTPAKWQSRHCHRSARSHQAQAALQLERRDPRTSVTFLHLACSGASITEGLLGRYGGIEPGRSQPPQVKRLKPLSRGRQVDAVIISIGINDLGFAELVKHCLLFTDCPNQAFPNPLLSPRTLDQVMQERLKSLINLENKDDFSKLYDKLAGSLKRAGIPAQHVFITEYFDSTKDESGQTCDPLISVFSPVAPWYTNAVEFDRAEAQWANDRILGPLNAAVRAAASKHGWRLVAGAAERFRTHGYCSTDPWIVGLTESVASQGNPDGTLHSTARGNREQAVLVKKQVQRCFYPNNRTRPPGKTAPPRC